MLDLVVCPDPDCGVPAIVQQRDLLESTHGPVEHVRITCVKRHYFNMPSASLTPL